LETLKSKLNTNDQLFENEVLDQYFDKIHLEIEQRPIGYLADAKVQADEQVFKNIYIPRTLDEIDIHDADLMVKQAKRGEYVDVIIF
jgi:RIO kinase 1